MQIITKSAQETTKFGYDISKLIKSPFTILLEGNLAAGKTTFTKGLAKGLGIKNTVNSPSFTIMKQYEINDIYFNHFDFYRMNSLGQDYDLEEYLENSISVIEWPYQVIDLLPQNYLLINFEYINEYERKITVTAKGSKYEEFLKCIS